MHLPKRATAGPGFESGTFGTAVRGSYNYNRSATTALHDVIVIFCYSLQKSGIPLFYKS